MLLFWSLFFLLTRSRLAQKTAKRASSSYWSEYCLLKRVLKASNSLRLQLEAETVTTSTKPSNTPNKTLTSTTTRTVGPQVSPATFDWRSSSKKILTPVYDQEQCGSCWAFSATENIESQWALAGNALVSLSVQQIVDCDSTSYGCGGGWTQNAYNSVIKEGGQESWSEYPYTAQNGNCQFSSSKIVAKISSWENVYANNEDAMASWLAQNGPISICVDASQWSDYSGGVMTASQCGSSIDHCVLAVGYNTQANPPYWIVRNSWGTSWGVENGFIYLQYGTNTCELAFEPTSAKI